MQYDFYTCFNLIMPDLREDKQYLSDHPGATPISTAQVSPIIDLQSLANFLKKMISLCLVVVFLYP